MSYAFSCGGATKAEAKAAVAEKLAEVVTNQPIHEVDQVQAQAAADAFIDLLPEPGEGKKFSISMSGSVGWRGEREDRNLTGAGVNVSVHIADAA